MPKYLRIKVIPKSPITEIVGEMADGTLKVRVKAAPEKGKANAELTRFLSKHFGAQVTIVSGESERIKLIKISNPTQGASNIL